ncbi:MAG: hypothetical protein HOO91_15915 [Bacteroidales bacterium]|nr:hypothetical protein [Bacteroidales bacterium]
MKSEKQKEERGKRKVKSEKQKEERGKRKVASEKQKEKSGKCRCLTPIPLNLVTWSIPSYFRRGRGGY